MSKGSADPGSISYDVISFRNNDKGEFKYWLGGWVREKLLISDL